MTPRIRMMSVAAAAAVALWPAIGVTFSLGYGSRYPDAAGMLWPWGVKASMVAAQALATPEASSGDRAEAERRALAGLRREPLNVAAARTLGQVAALAGATDRASHLYGYAETVSRRDLLTQVWLIETDVARGDIPGVLKHYDRALRTSRDAPDLLLPTLAAASGDPAVRVPLERILAQRPPWTLGYLWRLAESQPDMAVVASQLRVARLDMAAPLDKGILIAAVGRMLQNAAYRPAIDLVRHAKSVPASFAGPLRNGNFAGDNVLPPIDWLLSDDTDLSAYMETVSGGPPGRVLHVQSNGRTGDVARQMLVLAPGSYRLTARAGAVAGPDGSSGAIPRVTLSCAAGGAILARSEGAARSGRLTLRFTVPAPCAGQWLAISSVATDRMDAWIGDMVLVAE